ncbi:MAG TPA: hypothetical protein VFF78_00055 [Anaerolineaceae bacterium]|nr:hypothetical protein [Anaerolineaceae bacterium]
MSEWEVVYLLPQSNGGDIWAIRGEETQQITQTSGRVYDYSIVPDGQSIIYSQNNPSGGLDLWRAPRSGQQAYQLLDCGKDWCNEGVMSLDGSTLAYSRSEYASQPAGSVNSRIWTLDIVSGNTTPLFRDAFIAGETPSWSPDGAYLVFFDPIAKGLRIVDMSSGESQFLSSDFASGSWSGDGKYLAFVDRVVLSAEEVISRLYVVDIATQEIRPLTELEEAQIDYSAPAWSPDGEWLAVGWRYAGGPPGKQLKLINLQSGKEQVIAQDLTYSHTSYHWSTDGSWLVFQRVKLGDSQARPEVWVWERLRGESRLLVQNAAWPQILP